jgi:hypothetical protein
MQKVLKVHFKVFFELNFIFYLESWIFYFEFFMGFSFNDVKLFAPFEP